MAGETACPTKRRNSNGRRNRLPHQTQKLQWQAKPPAPPNAETPVAGETACPTKRGIDIGRRNRLPHQTQKLNGRRNCRGENVASASGEGRFALLHKVPHAFLEVLALQAGTHLHGSRVERLTERLEHRLVNL